MNSNHWTLRVPCEAHGAKVGKHCLPGGIVCGDRMRRADEAMGRPDTSHISPPPGYEQREREARPIQVSGTSEPRPDLPQINIGPYEYDVCPAWEDGQHAFDLVFGTFADAIKAIAKRCACGKTIGRTKP